MDFNANNEIDLNNIISKEIVIRTLFNHESRFIVLPCSDFSLDNYMRAGKSPSKKVENGIILHNMRIISVQAKFRINGDSRINAVLTDNLRTPIPANKFCAIVQNYKNSGSFYVHLEYEVIQQKPILITAEVKIKIKFCLHHAFYSFFDPSRTIVVDIETIFN